MILTKLIGLTSALTKSKNAKIGLLILEIIIVAVAYNNNKEAKEKEDFEEQERLYLNEDSESK